MSVGLLAAPSNYAVFDQHVRFLQGMPESDCPALRAVYEGAWKAGCSFRIVEQKESGRLIGSHATMVELNGHLFVLHFLTNVRLIPRTQDRQASCTNVCKTSLENSTGQIFYVSVPGYRMSLLLVVPSNDIKAAFFNNKSRDTVYIYIPLNYNPEQARLHFLSYQDKWGCVPPPKTLS